MCRLSGVAQTQAWKRNILTHYRVCGFALTMGAFEKSHSWNTSLTLLSGKLTSGRSSKLLSQKANHNFIEPRITISRSSLQFPEPFVRNRCYHRDSRRIQRSGHRGPEGELYRSSCQTSVDYTSERIDTSGMDIPLFGGEMASVYTCNYTLTHLLWPHQGTQFVYCRLPK